MGISSSSDLGPFVARHIGSTPEDIAGMLAALNVSSLDALLAEAIPSAIRTAAPLDLPRGESEHALLTELRALARENQVLRSFIGMGYVEAVVPPPIQRNILENPGWYTQYTPYQAEISQGRLEALLNFQTMVTELTGLEIANASLLDEATAAAEAMNMCAAIRRRKTGNRFLVAEDCHPQTITVVETRAEPLGIEVVVQSHSDFVFDGTVFGVLVQYPTTFGHVHDYAELCDRAHAANALVTVAADPLALTLLTPPGEFGADIAVGSTQRFGVPMGYGGPHAAYMAARDAFKRKLPGRVVGVSRDVDGNPALRLALQSREQHIRRENATSNICTSQVLLAIMASMYAVHHGPDGLRRIARRVVRHARSFGQGLARLGFLVEPDLVFDTVTVAVDDADRVVERARQTGLNLRRVGPKRVGITFDEACGEQDVVQLWRTISGQSDIPFEFADAAAEVDLGFGVKLDRISPPLRHPVFRNYHAEHDFLRYVQRLQARDLSLTTSMIALGSCTMKLNAAAEMLPITWPEFANIHPFAPTEQAAGYQKLLADLEKMLAEITGLSAVSLQPNAGSQGEYTGLQVIRRYHRECGQTQRNVCLIPESAHGTNPASSVLAGMRVVIVRCDEKGNIDLADLASKAAEHATNLAAIMVTYPSTHGVFEDTIIDLCRIVHDHGGQVYLDGANLNAQVGLCRPGEYGVDVCHLNLHKTFAIPHGGGGPGVGPIAVAEHLRDFLPGHAVVECGGSRAIGSVSAAPFGSPLVLPISWMYLRLMGGEGLRYASAMAVLNANYMASQLEPYFPVLYRGKSGRVAHEFILDLRQFKKSCGITVTDVAKRLMDYGFHAPTISWPVAGTMMIEPTESESKAELDRLIQALISIRSEIEEIEQGKAEPDDNLLVNAPHTALSVTDDDWPHSYSRQRAAFPAQWTRVHKFWPPVGRIDDAWGDRNLVCACPPLEKYDSRPTGDS